MTDTNLKHAKLKNNYIIIPIIKSVLWHVIAKTTRRCWRFTILITLIMDYYLRSFVF